MSNDLERAAVAGFGAATVIPAAASTLRQALREGAPHLHVLADYYRRACRRPEVRMRLLRNDRHVNDAAISAGKVLVEQGINGTTFFLAVKLALVTFGTWGGILAQLAITANVMLTPGQTQIINPARSVLGADPLRQSPASLLRARELEMFAFGLGAFAALCGYGDAGQAPPNEPAGRREKSASGFVIMARLDRSPPRFRSRYGLVRQSVVRA